MFQRLMSRLRLVLCFARHRFGHLASCAHIESSLIAGRRWKRWRLVLIYRVRVVSQLSSLAVLV